MSVEHLRKRIAGLEVRGAGLCKCPPGFICVGERDGDHEYPYTRAEDVPPCPECGKERLVLKVVYEERAETNPLDGAETEPVPKPEPKPTRPPLPEFGEGRERRGEDDDGYGAALIETVMRR